MTSTDAGPRAATSRDRSTAARAGLGVGVALMVVAMAVPALTGWDVHVRYFPPLHAEWHPRVGPGTLPALLVAMLASLRAVDLADRLSWGRLLLAVYAAGVAWMLALAFVDGRDGVGQILQSSYEYLGPARETDDLPATLREYVDRIPYAAGDRHWPPHLAGHPPGALAFFVLLVRLGLGGGFAAGLVVTLIAASTAVAVLVTLRTLGAEGPARRAAPFVTLGPAAIWQCVSADGMFAAVTAWGLAALAVAAVRARGSSPAATSPAWPVWTAWSVAAGLLLGYGVMLSYGLVLMGLPALAVLVAARSWRPLLPAVVVALAVVLVFAALGFSWWDGMQVLHERYWDGVARNRPASYWLWGNLAALMFSAGPLTAAGLAHAATRRASGGEAVRVVRLLAFGALASVLLANASLMSKAEVERIWLPFVPWLLVSCALLPARWRRAGLTGQLVLALVVQHLLDTGW